MTSSAATVLPDDVRPMPRLVVGLLAFFTLVDLFAAQALAPMLAHAYRTTAGSVGLAVNASTLGMAAGAFATGLWGGRLDRRTGITASLVLLAVPTALLAIAPNLQVFFALRVVQGVCMSTAFTLALAHLAEAELPGQQAGAFAAYVTGNVASNLVGRLAAATAAGTWGLGASFLLFAALNLAGAALAWNAVRPHRTAPPPQASLSHLRKAIMVSTLAGFGVGFCILFAFIGVFSYVNFLLMGPGLGLGMMGLGAVYFIFLPSIFLTPLAGGLAARAGARPALWGGLAVAGAGIGLLAVHDLLPILAGLALFAVGTFAAQAVATGFVSRSAGEHRSAASGLYLASYFTGGLVGSAVLGQAYDQFGWGACLFGAGAALALCAALGVRFTEPRPAS